MNRTYQYSSHQGELHRIKEFCIDVAAEKEEEGFLAGEQRQRMMGKHRKSLKGFHMTYGVPEPPAYSGGFFFSWP